MWSTDCSVRPPHLRVFFRELFVCCVARSNDLCQNHRTDQILPRPTATLRMPAIRGQPQCYTANSLASQILRVSSDLEPTELWQTASDTGEVHEALSTVN